MLIAVATNGSNPGAVVPETFEESTNLLIVETDTDSVLTVYNSHSDDGNLYFAKKTILHDCEAIVCGKMQMAGFEELASNSVTRYYGSGLPAVEAAKAAEQNILPLITDYEGGTGCGSHEVNMCEEHLKEIDD